MGNSQCTHIGIGSTTMNWNYFSVGAGLLLTMSGVCYGATPFASGVIHFQGSITEPPCSTTRHSNALRFKDCPTVAHTQDMRVQKIEQRQAISSADNLGVSLKRVKNSGATKAYDNQEFLLVDGTGSPVSTGVYIITLTAL